MSARYKFSRKRLLADLSRLPQFENMTVESDWGLAKCRSFYIRWFINADKGWIEVQFGVKKCFDKWGNSTDFETNLHYEDGLFRNDIVKCHRWMEKVVRSGLFDFNSYIGTIQAEHFSMQNPGKYVQH